METLLEILVGQLPEAIYFALFLLFTKEIKEKRFRFILITSFEYILLFQGLRLNIWAHILFFVLTYILLKILYKERAQITDIFTLGIASIIVILIGILSYATVRLVTDNFYVYAIITKILLFIILFILKPKLHKIQKIYKKLWNRNDKISKKMKSTTFRALNTVIFNCMFAVINFGLIMSVFLFRG